MFSKDFFEPKRLEKTIRQYKGDSATTLSGIEAKTAERLDLLGKAKRLEAEVLDLEKAKAKIDARVELLEAIAATEESAA